MPFMGKNGDTRTNPYDASQKQWFTNGTWQDSDPWSQANPTGNRGTADQGAHVAGGWSSITDADRQAWTNQQAQWQADQQKSVAASAAQAQTAQQQHQAMLQQQQKAAWDAWDAQNRAIQAQNSGHPSNDVPPPVQYNPYANQQLPQAMSPSDQAAAQKQKAWKW